MVNTRKYLSFMHQESRVKSRESRVESRESRYASRWSSGLLGGLVPNQTNVKRHKLIIEYISAPNLAHLEVCGHELID